MKSGPSEISLKDADLERKSELEKDLGFIKKFKDPRFGEVSVVRHGPTKRVLIVQELRFTEKEQAKKHIARSISTCALKHSYLSTLIDYSGVKQTELCSSFYLVRQFFEFPRNDLKKEMTQRSMEGQEFTSNEVAHVLFQQMSVLSFLQSSGLSHGDLRPLSILYDKLTKNSRLVYNPESSATLEAAINHQKNRLLTGFPLYQSPDMFNNLKKGQAKFQVNLNKEDAFALGMVALEVGNGKSVQDVYDHKAGRFSAEKLQAHLDEFRQNFGGEQSLLPKTVSLMLQLEEKKRPSFKELDEMFPNYEAQLKHSIERASIRVSQPEVVILKEQPLNESTPPGLFDFSESMRHLRDVEAKLDTDLYTKYADNYAKERASLSNDELLKRAQELEKQQSGDKANQQ